MSGAGSTSAGRWSLVVVLVAGAGAGAGGDAGAMTRYDTLWTRYDTL